MYTFDIGKPIRVSFLKFLHCVVVINAVATLSACDKVSEEEVPQEDRWIHMSDLNTPHQYHAGVVVDGKIFAVGGSQPFTRSPAEFEQYDPATNQWTILPNMPTPRLFLGAAAAQNMIYTIGGLDESQDTGPAVVESYDIVNKTWHKREDLPTPRHRLAAVAFNGKIYAIGGMDLQGNTDVVEAYDPESDSWVRKANMPTPRHGHSAVVVDDLILVIGGYSGRGFSGEPIATVEAYNPAMDQWVRKADMPTPRGFLGVAFAKGHVYAIAGRVSDNPIERYDPNTDSWEWLGSMPGSFRNRFGVGVVDDLIYVMGGELQTDASIPTSVLRYEPSDS